MPMHTDFSPQTKVDRDSDVMPMSVHVSVMCFCMEAKGQLRVSCFRLHPLSFETGSVIGWEFVD